MKKKLLEKQINFYNGQNGFHLATDGKFTKIRFSTFRVLERNPLWIKSRILKPLNKKVNFSLSLKSLEMWQKRNLSRLKCQNLFSSKKKKLKLMSKLNIWLQLNTTMSFPHQYIGIKLILRSNCKNQQINSWEKQALEGQTWNQTMAIPSHTR